METELKLHIFPENIEKFLQHPLLQTAIHHPAKRLYNTYFDTMDGQLLQKNIGLRIRRVNNKRLQTIKTAGSGLGGLHQRQEWEVEVEGDTPNYQQFPQEILTELLDKKTFEQIRPLFTTDFSRSCWNLHSEDGTMIEIALDQGQVTDGNKSIPISEVELELKSGTADKLYQIALILQDSVPLIIDNQSKAAKGYALRWPMLPKIYKAAKIELESTMTAEQVFTTIFWHELKHLQENEEVVLAASDIEGVHQMRVALRRLRACLSLYQPLISKKTSALFREEMRWFAHELGIARDWDVFGLALTQINQQTHYPLLTDLQRQVSELQQQSYTHLRSLLRSPRYSRLLLLLGEWLTRQGWRSHFQPRLMERLEQPAKEFADVMLQQRYLRLCEQGKNLTQLTAEQRHAFRIAVKKISYGMRFFASLYPLQPTQDYIKVLSQLQDELGLLNDSVVAIRLLQQLGLKSEIPARCFLEGWYAHQQAVHLEKLAETWQRLLIQQIFWQ